MGTSEPQTKVVLDTNVVLDWLHFDDAGTRALAACIASGRVSVLANSLALDELKRVLAYPALEITSDRQTAILSRYQAQTGNYEMPVGFTRHNLMLPATFPRCRDEDDQHFLALAFHSKAQALITKDKALLKMARRARPFGMRIVEPSTIHELLRSAA